MELRNGKTIKTLPILHPTESNNSVGICQDSIFLELLNQINTTDNIILRIHNMIDIYTYLDNRIMDYKNQPTSANFMIMLRKKTVSLYTELALSSMKYGEDLNVLGLILLLSTKMISVLAKLGEH